MSFHEKSAWACVVAIGIVYVPYFSVVMSSPMSAMALFWLAAAGLVAILVAFHTVNALATKSIRVTGDTPPVDELDQRIELKASKWAGFVLSVAVITWIVFAMYTAPVIGVSASELSATQISIPISSVLIAVHWLFAGFVVANVTYYGGIVMRYRRIAGA
jgi:hypothetical protein